MQPTVDAAQLAELSFKSPLPKGSMGHYARFSGNGGLESDIPR